MKKVVLLVFVVMAFIGCTNKNMTVLNFDGYEGQFTLLAAKDTLLSANVTKANNSFEFEWNKEFKNPSMVTLRLEGNYSSAYCYFEKGNYKISTEGERVLVSSKVNDQITEVERKINEAPVVKELQRKTLELSEKKRSIEKRLGSIKLKKSEEYKSLTDDWISCENYRRETVAELKDTQSELVYSYEEGLPLCIYLMNNRYRFVYDVSSGNKILEIVQKVHAKEQTDFTASMVKGFTMMLDSEQKKELTKVGKHYVDVIANDIKGEQTKLSDVIAENKIVLLKFWASWCGPCVRSIPETLELSDKYGKKGFQVYAISLDTSKKLWEKAIRKHKISNWVNTSELRGFDAEEHLKYGVTGIPKEILISKEGKILGVNLSKAWLDRYVKEACE